MSRCKDREVRLRCGQEEERGNVSDVGGYRTRKRRIVSARTTVSFSYMTITYIERYTCEVNNFRCPPVCNEQLKNMFIKLMHTALGVIIAAEKRLLLVVFARMYLCTEKLLLFVVS